MLLRLVLLLSLSVPGFSFQTNKISLNDNLTLVRRTSSLDLSSPLFGEDANEEEFFGDNSERSMKDGKDMANLFYKEMQRRTDDSSDESAQDPPPRDEASSSTPPLPPPPPLQAQRIEDLRKLIANTGKTDTAASTNIKDDTVTPTTKQPTDTKFTGQNSIPPPQRFSRSPREAFLSGNNNNAGPRTPREVMMEREYNLVDRAERNIGVQAVFAVLALTFYIYIGLSGGISSRLDGPDLGADEMLPFEQMVPIPKDRENTVWL